MQLVSDGTDTHLILIKLIGTDINGRRQRKLFAKPVLSQTATRYLSTRCLPKKTSGVRFGTPAVTSRGMGKDEMSRLPPWL
jgi:glycine hydroxymethyltransferase